MSEKHSFFMVDDDEMLIMIMKELLEQAGHTLFSTTTSTTAREEIIQRKPDCILLDIMMPELDGFELLGQLRREPKLAETKIVMLSSKPYEFDRKRSISLGADGYFTKPVDPTIVDHLQEIIEDKMALTFWGVRGTLPVPGEKSLKYGGNTSCVSLSLPREHFLIFDAGSGIKTLSNHLIKDQVTLAPTKILISHPHWDHINTFPFFAPLYIPGNEIEIYGSPHGDISTRDIISAQMDGVYFPINIKEFGAGISFHDIRKEEITFDNIKVRTMLLNHPGNTLGYRVEYKDRSVCYVTDNEIYPESSQYYSSDYIERLTAFIRGTEALIMDATYSEEEYAKKTNWGHSSVVQVANLAADAAVKTLFLFHHDPDQSDDDIDAKLETAQTLLGTRQSGTICIAPKEGQVFKI